MKYIGNIVESGIFEKIDKNEYLRALDRLNVLSGRFRKDSVIFSEGDEINKVCIIARGSVRGEKSYPDGDIHILNLYDEGQMFGIETAVSKKKTAPIAYVANEDCLIIYITLSSINSSGYEQEISEVLMQYMADDIIRQMHKIDILAEKSLRKRIMMYLEILRAKSGTDVFTVNMNREQLAQYLCVNRSALSNELNKMKREEIIDFDKKYFRFL